MKTKSKIFLAVFSCGLALTAINDALAQTTSSTDEFISLAPTVELTAADLESPEPKIWNFWSARLQLYITTNAEKRAELAEKLTDMELVRLVETNKAKRTKAAERAYEKFTNNQAELEQILAATTDPTAQAKIKTQMAKNKILYAAFMDKIVADGSELQTRIQAKRETMLKEAAAKLNQLSEEEAKKKVEEVFSLLEAKEKVKEKKYDKKLALLENLDKAENKNEAAGAETDDDDTLDKTLEAKQTEIAIQLAAEDPEIIKKLAGSSNDKYQRHLLVLQSVHDKAPESAKPALQKVIDQQTEKLVEKSQDNAGIVGEIFKGKKVDAEMEKKIKAKIEATAKEKNINVNEAINKAAEITRERQTEIEKTKTEKAKKIEEAAKEKTTEVKEKVKEGATEKIKEKAAEIKEAVKEKF